MELRIWIDDNGPNNAGHNGRAPPWTCVLVIVETTVRKAWAYPMHSKNSREVLYNFKKFFCRYRYENFEAFSDSCREYNMIKDFK